MTKRETSKIDSRFLAKVELEQRVKFDIFFTAEEFWRKFLISSWYGGGDLRSLDIQGQNAKDALQDDVKLAKNDFFVFVRSTY